MRVVARREEAGSRPIHDRGGEEEHDRQVNGGGNRQPEGGRRVGTVGHGEGERRKLDYLTHERHEHDDRRESGGQDQSTPLASGYTSNPPPHRGSRQDDAPDDEPEREILCKSILGRRPAIVDVERPQVDVGDEESDRARRIGDDAEPDAEAITTGNGRHRLAGSRRTRGIRRGRLC